MVDDMLSEPTANMSHKWQKSARIIFYVLALIVVAVGGIPPVFMRINGISWSQILTWYAHRDIASVVNMTFWCACLASVLRVRGAAHFVFVTALWNIALRGHGFATVIYGLISHFFPSSIIHFIVKEIPVWKGITHLVWIGFFLIALLARHVDAAYGQRNQTTISGDSHFTRAEKLFGACIAVVYLIVALRWIGLYLLPYSYYSITIPTSYILLCATITIMICQCFIRRYFFAVAAISMPLAALFMPIIANLVAMATTQEKESIYTSCLQPISALPGQTFLMWTPMLVIGGLALFSKKLNMKIRCAAFAVPVSLMLIAIFNGLPLDDRIYTDSISSINRPADWPTWMAPVEGATDIHYGTSKTNDTKGVDFKIVEPYPATRVLTIISDRLREAGFRKLDYSLLNPDMPFSGWGEYERRINKPETKVHVWQGDWLNKENTSARALLEYHCSKSGAEDLNTLYVSIYLQPPEGWHKKRIELYKRLHPPDGSRETEQNRRNDQNDLEI